VTVTRPDAETGEPLLVDAYDTLLLDLDGVVYVGPEAVPHAVESIAGARARGVLTAYVTNHAARPPAEVSAHLRSLGLEVVDDDVVTSAQAGAAEIAARVAPGSRVLAVGGPGVPEALRARGLEPVSLAREEPSAVLMGFGPDVSWRQLAEASYAVAAGALFVATNLDLSIPQPQGMAPGNGTSVAAVTAATGIAPMVAGKPYAPLVRESIERVGARSPLMVGDRLDTDIEAGHVSAIASLLVLTGVTGVDELLAAPPHRRPTYLAADLRGLLRPAAELAVLPAPDLHERGAGDRLERLRAVCRAVWAAADAGEERLVDDSERARLAADVAVALAE
jgi:glycerol 3-phosphatase-2